MRFKNRAYETLQLLTFAFYPKTTLIACAVFSVFVITILGAVMAVMPKESTGYDIVFALTTGAAGSSIVSFVVELSSNYKHNRLAWHELQEYYSAVIHYEGHKQIMLRQAPHQRAEIKAHEEFVAAGGIEDILDLDYNKPKDIIQITWKLLPDFIPAFSSALRDKKEFLSNIEIDELKYILSEYGTIQSMIQQRILMSPMTYDALNHPDEDYLKSIYPSDVVKNMPDWVRKHLARNESQKACERYVEAIFSDKFLLSDFMKNYDISQHGIDSYQSELDRLEEAEEKEPEEIDYDELDFSEPEDEETFRAQREEFDRQMELEERPFVSWCLSTCCQNISQSIDNLEKSMLNKPYYGMMIKYYQTLEKEPLDGIVASTSYEYEKKRLDKKLAKQKESASRE